MLAMRHAPYHPLLFILLGTVNAAPAPKAPSLNIRTAEDLAVACAGRPTTPSNAAMLNFCNGFAQGVVQTESHNPSGSKICFPKPAPKRSKTMAEYARWVSADGARKTEVASTSLIRFMLERYSCKG
jgi:Rap1a immunity proteins